MNNTGITLGIIGARCCNIANYDYRLYEYKKILSNLERILKTIDKKVGIKQLYSTNLDGIGQLTYLAKDKLKDIANYPYNLVVQSRNDYLYNYNFQIRNVNKSQLSNADKITHIYTNNHNNVIYTLCDFIIILDTEKNRELYKELTNYDKLYFMNIRDMFDSITPQLKEVTNHIASLFT